MDFEIISHTADLKIHVYGTTKQELFKNALCGMFQAMRPISSSCHYENERMVCDQLPIVRDFGVDSPDLDSLLVDFLSNALYLGAIHHEAYLDVTLITFDDMRVLGCLKGVAITGLQESEVKAVTYHDLGIIQKDGLWQTDIVFDV